MNKNQLNGNNTWSNRSLILPGAIYKLRFHMALEMAFRIFFCGRKKTKDLKLDFPYVFEFDDLKVSNTDIYSFQ